MVRRGRGREPRYRATTLATLWREQLDAPEPEPEPWQHELARGWMLEAGLAEALEPCIGGLAARRGELSGIWGMGSETARTLLDRLPDSELDARQNDSPTMRCLLTAIAGHPQVTGIGYVVGPDRPDERVSLTGVLVDDAEMVAFTPDVVLGTVPAFVDELDDGLHAEYEEHRLGCVTSSVHRQRWHAARHRYSLDDALHGPTEITEEGPLGDRVLRFWWT